jgi:hypothetical protein
VSATDKTALTGKVPNDAMFVAPYVVDGPFLESDVFEADTVYLKYTIPQSDGYYGHSGATWLQIADNVAQAGDKKFDITVVGVNVFVSMEHLDTMISILNQCKSGKIKLSLTEDFVFIGEYVGLEESIGESLNEKKSSIALGCTSAGYPAPAWYPPWAINNASKESYMSTVPEKSWRENLNTDKYARVYDPETGVYSIVKHSELAGLD